MSINLRTNIAAVNAIRRLDLAGRDLSATLNRLSSGLRIVNPSDDAAGLAIGTAIKADSRVYAQGIRNINDGISVLNIAEGGLSQLAAITIRQKELAEQAANGVYSGRQRVALDAEASALTKEYNRIIRSVAFGGNRVLDGTDDSLTIQQGYGSWESTLLSIGSSLGFAAGSGENFTTVGAVTPGGTGAFSVNGDIDGDGDIDIITVNSNSTSLVARLNDGNGNLTGNVVLDTGVTGSLTIGDFNGDGITDIVRAQTTNLFFYRGTGGGSFAASVSFATPASATNLIAEDFNGDGILDIAYRGANHIGVAIGNGDGTFRAANTYVGTGVSNRFRAGDLNNDGVLDIVSTGGRILIGNADGSFSTMINLGTATSSTDLKLVDLDGDGNLDIIDSGNTVIYGNGNGTFSAATSLNLGLSNGSAAIADYNGDGFLDVALGEAIGGDISILFGNGDRSFRTGSQLIAVGAAPTHMFGSDMNGDGIPDVVAVEYTLSGIHTFLNEEDSSGRRNNHIYALNLKTISGAREALDITTAQLTRINQELGKIGALQSRLTTSIQNIQTRRTNYESAAGQIMDVDVAEEAARLTSRRILQQGATAVLSQANQQPQIALRLLGNLNR